MIKSGDKIMMINWNQMILTYLWNTLKRSKNRGKLSIQINVPWLHNCNIGYRLISFDSTSWPWRPQKCHDFNWNKTNSCKWHLITVSILLSYSHFNIGSCMMAEMLDLGPKRCFAMGVFGWILSVVVHQQRINFRWESLVNIFCPT